ncbi:hypothetical protein HOLleu_42137 [Holothuria leucospilota]|uniref:C2H2-type domain-containing protein n=1 Tax=Holothuria leucospilota TaxID=206669 RepID=A0A9Q0YD96_HOLLE|nr:hypothetical protein HOLleu_42137 [Holothuria leucospilota]
MTCLVDTGANISIIQAGVLFTVPPRERPQLELKGLSMVLADGKRVPILGKAEMVVTIGDKRLSHEFWVADIGPDCILGLDFLRRHNCVINARMGRVMLGSEQPMHEPSEAAREDFSSRIISAETFVLKANSEMIVEARVKNFQKEFAESRKVVCAGVTLKNEDILDESAAKMTPKATSWTSEELIAHQGDDPDLLPIIQGKAGQEKPPWESVSGGSKVLRHYWSQWDSLVLKDGLLFRRFEDMASTWGVKYECQKCGRQYGRIPDREHHARKRHGTILWTCENCKEYQSVRKWDVQRHEIGCTRRFRTVTTETVGEWDVSPGGTKTDVKGKRPSRGENQEDGHKRGGDLREVPESREKESNERLEGKNEKEQTEPVTNTDEEGKEKTGEKRKVQEAQGSCKRRALKGGLKSLDPPLVLP